MKELAGVLACWRKPVAARCPLRNEVINMLVNGKPYLAVSHHRHSSRYLKADHEVTELIRACIMLL